MKAAMLWEPETNRQKMQQLKTTIFIWRSVHCFTVWNLYLPSLPAYGVPQCWSWLSSFEVQGRGLHSVSSRSSCKMDWLRICHQSNNQSINHPPFLSLDFRTLWCEGHWIFKVELLQKTVLPKNVQNQDYQNKSVNFLSHGEDEINHSIDNETYKRAFKTSVLHYAT